MQQQLPKTLDAIDKSKLPTEVKNKLKEAAINTAISGNSEGNSNAYTPTSYKGGNGGTNYQVPTTPEGMEDYVNALKTAGLNDSEIATVIKQNAGLTGKPLAQVFTPSVIAALKDIDPEVAQSIVQALAGDASFAGGEDEAAIFKGLGEDFAKSLS
ncbi:MAG: hypothetical protein ACKVTZ_10970 [Bacteroidia bacterium]